MDDLIHGSVAVPVTIGRPYPAIRVPVPAVRPAVGSRVAFHGMRFLAVSAEMRPLIRRAVAAAVVFNALHVPVGVVIVPLVGLARAAGIEGAAGDHAVLVLGPGVRPAVRVDVPQHAGDAALVVVMDDFVHGSVAVAVTVRQP